MSILKSCPFCGSHNLKFEVKNTSRDKRFKVFICCRKCGASGRQVLVKTKEFYRYDVELNDTYRHLAEYAWNNRYKASTKE